MSLGRCAALLLLLGFALPAHAHRPSDAFLSLEIAGARVHGQWSVALRDLEAAVGVDADRDGAITWGELKAARPRIEAALAESVRLQGPGDACALRATNLQADDRIEGNFATITLEADCTAVTGPLQLRYRFLFGRDPTHRGIIVMRAGEATRTVVLDPRHDTVDVAGTPRWRTFGDYLREGVHHIWIGADHVLFLLSLLLPCVLRREADAWLGAPRLAPAAWRVAGVVTAFTLAHSITLGLAAFGVLGLPSALAESAIALSVVTAALNNVWPLVTHARWALAFVFGLLHGFGFASVLGELGLPDGARLLALVAFNLGVEVGQLAIVAVVLPPAFALRHTLFYRRGVVTAGSLAIVAVASLWFAQRTGFLG